MNLKNQKKIAAQILKAGKTRIWFDPDRLSEIKEAITKSDIKSLISNLAIQKKPKKGISRFKARKRIIQRRKGRQKGMGSRKGKRRARLPRKEEWINKIRTQRKLLKNLKEKKLITPSTYRELYAKSKGNFFRSKRHIKLYLEGNKLIQK